MSLSKRLAAYRDRFSRQRTDLLDRNIWNLYWDIFWFGILSGIVSSFLSVYAIRLGASNTIIGLLTALPALVQVVWLVPAARLVEGQRQRMPIIIVSGTLMRLTYLGLALVPTLVADGRPELFLAIVVIGTIPAGLGNIAFSAMMAEAVPLHLRARVVSIRSLLLAVTSMAASFLGGRLLEVLPFPANYQFLFGIGFLASLVSLYYVTRIWVPDAPAPASAAGGRQTPFRQLLRANPRFIRFTLASFIFHIGLFWPGPLYSIYWVKYLNATEGWIGLMLMIQSAANAVSNYFWGRVATRRGNRPVLLICTAGLVLYPVLTAFSTTLTPLLLVSVSGGFFGAGVNLTFFNLMLETSPAERRPTFIAVYNSLLNLLNFITPLLATALIEVIGIRTDLLIGGTFRLLGVIAFLFLLKKVSEKPASSDP